MRGLTREIMENFNQEFYWTYVLYSLKDNNKYIGYTKNLPLRFEAHKKGKVKSTKHRRPLILIYFEACISQKDALKREKYFKTHYGKMFLGNRLKSYFTGRDINRNNEKLN